jgi:hypothetical protein
MLIRELLPSELSLAAGVLARGMRDNPNIVAAFGGKSHWREQVLTAFFQAVLAGLIKRGVILGALDSVVVQGVCGMARPGKCRPALVEKFLILRVLLATVPLNSVMRLGQWMRNWSRHDTAVMHWHLGPAAVDRHLQHRGIGGAMLDAVCQRLDREGATAYLETDKRENVSFYQKYGFKIVGTSIVLGQTNWYMARHTRRSEVNTDR